MEWEFVVLVVGELYPKRNEELLHYAGLFCYNLDVVDVYDWHILEFCKFAMLRMEGKQSQQPAV